MSDVKANTEKPKRISTLGYLYINFILKSQNRVLKKFAKLYTLFTPTILQRPILGVYDALLAELLTARRRG